MVVLFVLCLGVFNIFFLSCWRLMCVFIVLVLGTSRQRSEEGAIRKKIPTPKPEVEKN